LVGDGPLHWQASSSPTREQTNKGDGPAPKGKVPSSAGYPLHQFADNDGERIGLSPAEPRTALYGDERSAAHCFVLDVKERGINPNLLFDLSFYGGEKFQEFWI
jgi:hypothetical protein